MYPRRPRDRRPLIAGVAAATVVAAAVVAYVVVRGNDSGANSGGAAKGVGVTIPSDGAQLAAEVTTPHTKGPAPLVVMPASWGGDATMYRSIAALFARSGYAVVAYAQRGFGNSTGKVDFAGPATQHDASTVITWAVRHLKVDPQEIGMLGTSYGAGISLLTAAHDARVKAVAALSAWADLADTYDQGNTPNTGALGVLIGSKDRTPSFDPTTRHLQSTLLTTPTALGPELRRISPTRSAQTYLRQLNQHHPAIMLANGFEDSILNPAQLLPFFAGLTTPKRLELAPGDHGGPERSGLDGKPNKVVDDALAWLDHYVRGKDNGIDTEDPIVLTDGSTGQLRTYRTWPAATRKDRVALPGPGTTMQPGRPANSVWLATIHRAGVDSGASSAPMEFSPSADYVVATVDMAAIKASAAFVWNGPALTTPVVVSGTPSVHLGLSSSSRTATVYLHLYDVDPRGHGKLIDFQPYTATRLAETSARAVTIDMQPTSWTIASGHHLSLVIDTFDQRYQSLTPAGNSVTVSSSSASPATLAAPIG